MEVLVLFFLLGVGVLPLVLSIWALSRASNLAGRIHDLQQLIAELRREIESCRRNPAWPPLEVSQKFDAGRDRSMEETVEPSWSTTSPPPLPAPQAATTASNRVVSEQATEPIEQTLGGRVAAYAGVAALMLGVAFFVMYAIQRAWLGPEVRVALGLLAGAALIVIGHRLALRPDPPLALSRLLSGGGAGLFYVSLYAASAFYGLIGPIPTFIGLAGTSAAVFALATLYRSPGIAVLALLGVHGSPLVAGGDAPNGVFVVLVALIANMPIIALARRHGWRTPAVLAFALAWLQYAAATFGVWKGLDEAHGMLASGLAAALWVELAALADQLWARAPTRGGIAFAVHALNSLALLGALAWWFDTTRLRGWLGAVLLAGALAHLVWALPLRRRLGAVAEPVIARLLAGLVFACLALPAQLDGAWVSAGWILGGVLVAHLTARLNLPMLGEAALVMGLAGLGKSLLYDATLYATPPRLFFNARFAVSLFGAAALALQSRIWAAPRFAARPEASNPVLRGSATSLLLLTAGLAAAAGSVFADVGWWLGWSDPGGAALTTAALVALGIGLSALGRRNSAAWLATSGHAVLIAAALKVMLMDPWWTQARLRQLPPFAATAVWGWIGAMAVVVLAAQPGLTNPSPWPQVAALTAVIVTVTLELARTARGWRSSFITLWWALAALSLVLAGFAARRAAWRRLGLAVALIAAVKLFLSDIATLEGLHRVAAFLGGGAVMVLLSYLYQTAARMWLGVPPEGSPR